MLISTTNREHYCKQATAAGRLRTTSSNNCSSHAVTQELTAVKYIKQLQQNALLGKHRYRHNICWAEWMIKSILSSPSYLNCSGCQSTTKVFLFSFFFGRHNSPATSVIELLPYLPNLVSFLTYTYYAFIVALLCPCRLDTGGPHTATEKPPRMHCTPYHSHYSA